MRISDLEYCTMVESDAAPWGGDRSSNSLLLDFVNGKLTLKVNNELLLETWASIPETISISIKGPQFLVNSSVTETIHGIVASTVTISTFSPMLKTHRVRRAGIV